MSKALGFSIACAGPRLNGVTGKELLNKNGAGRVIPGVAQADADFESAIPSSCFALSKQHDYIRLPLFC